MKPHSLKTGFLLGILLSIPFIVFIYFADQAAGLPFVPFNLFDFMARVLPGSVVTFGIHLISGVIIRIGFEDVSGASKLAEQIIALLQFAVAAGVWGILLALIGRKKSLWLKKAGLISGLVLAVGFILINIYLGFPSPGMVWSSAWLLVVFSAWGWIFARLLNNISSDVQPKEDVRISRRGFIYLIGLSAVALVTGLSGFIYALQKRASSSIVSASNLFRPEATSGPAASPPRSELTNRIQPAPGTRPEITPHTEFYRIDINTRPPQVNINDWRLTVSGLVETSREFTIEELKTFPSVSQYITLSCISNSIGGSLISTALWTGLRLKDLLEEVGMLPEAIQVYLRATDGFYESVDMKDIQDDRTLLVYEMNGKPLPVEHGFPLRIYIPNRYGIKQPKWITSLEVIDYEGAGYWVDRGWSKEAYVYTSSVIDNVAENQLTQAGKIPTGGIAWSGERGISNVEVQIDDSPWQKAELRKPALSPLTWLQWRYYFKSKPGEHTIRVQAFDENGKLQAVENRNPDVSDANIGFHSRTFEI